MSDEHLPPLPGPDDRPRRSYAGARASVRPDAEPWSDEPAPGARGADPGDDQPVHYADDVDWEDWRGPTPMRRKILIGLGVLGALVLVVGLLGWNWVQGQIDPDGPPGAELDVEIAAGATTEDIGSQLADAGVIANATVWNYWTRLNDEGPFQAGLYTFQLDSSFDEAVAVLEGGPRPPQADRVTIPEGLTIPEIVARLGDPDQGIERWTPQAVQAAIDSGDIRSRYQPAEVTSMEGLLFPDTYEVAEDTDERTFVRRLVTELDQRLAALDVENGAAALGRTPYEIIIIASLIEEEARVEGDRAKISRVIHNRLAQGIPLGIDATNRYEAELAGRSRDDIDFDSDSPYNTRRVQGLVPTPIAAPGQASLEAALQPEEGDWIFYVLADAEGNHFFTDSNQEFLRAKERCRQAGLGCG